MSYESIFRHRGESYDFAMKKFPWVRDKEFQQLFSKIPLGKNEMILDIPALGGYLQKYCIENTVICLDFSKSINGIDVVSPYGKWPVKPVDRIVCLAAAHHIDDLYLFLNNMGDHLIENGIIHLADVALNSPISKFLDEFVGSNTSTGSHNGNYYDWNDVKYPTDLKVVNIENRPCPWIFESEHQMAEYCRFLFDLKNVKDKQIIDALSNFVGYENKEKCILNWNLTYIDLQSIRVKPASS